MTVANPYAWRFGLRLPCLSASSDLHMKKKSCITSSTNLAMVAARATALTAVRKLVTTIKLRMAALWNFPQEIVKANGPISPITHSTDLEAPGTPEFEKLLDRLKFPTAEVGRLK